MRKKKSKIRLLTEEPLGHSFSLKVDDNKEYMQMSSTSSDNQAQYDEKAPDLMCFLQAYFVLLISASKSLNDAIETLSTFPLSSFPVKPIQSVPLSPVQSVPLPLRRSTARLMPCSTDVCEYQSRCYCVKATAAITRGSAGLSVVWEWLCSRIRNLKEKVILTILSVGEQLENVEWLEESQWYDCEYFDLQV